MLVSVPELRERERLRGLAVQLGIQEPFDGDHLRLVRACCVFQGPAGACRIHARFGAEAKPTTCRLFPLVIVHTEHGVRMGVDPCCYHARSGGDDAPRLEPGEATGRPVHFDRERSAREKALLAAIDQPGASVAGLLAWLRDGTLGPPERLPAAFPQRWIAELGGAGLARFLTPEIAGPALRGALGEAFALAAELRPWAPPPWTGLGEEGERLVLAALRDLLHLRVCATSLPSPDDVAGLALRGAVLLAWTDPAPERMVRGLSAWIRLMRAPQFSGALRRPGSDRAVTRS